MNLTLLILLPLLTAVVILLMRSGVQVKWSALIGASVQFVLALILFFASVIISGRETFLDDFFSTFLILI
jgi:NADH:ubiquinone oxidoreductase subunit 4 (subunit M)